MFQGNVEQWLLALLIAAQSALHAVIRMASVAIKDPVFKLLEFMDTFPAQVLSRLIICVKEVVIVEAGFVSNTLFTSLRLVLIGFITILFCFRSVF